MYKYYFLRPETPGNQDCLAHIEDILLRSENIEIAVAYFTHMSIAKRIVDRARSGKITRVILNKHDVIRPDKLGSEIRISKALYELFNFVDEKWGNGDLLQLRFLGRHPSAVNSVFHHKFICSEHLVGFGSLNFTYPAFRNHYENFVVTDEFQVRCSFKAEFNQLWKAAEDFSLSGGSLRTFTCPECNTESVDFESYGAFCINCSHTFSFAED